MWVLLWFSSNITKSQEVLLPIVGNTVSSVIFLSVLGYLKWIHKSRETLINIFNKKDLYTG